jgi:hypothetical protein
MADTFDEYCKKLNEVVKAEIYCRLTAHHKRAVTPPPTHADRVLATKPKRIRTVP